MHDKQNMKRNYNILMKSLAFGFWKLMQRIEIMKGDIQLAFEY
mgnify:CR=1 FL=1